MHVCVIPRTTRSSTITATWHPVLLKTVTLPELPCRPCNVKKLFVARQFWARAMASAWVSKTPPARSAFGLLTAHRHREFLPNNLVVTMATHTQLVQDSAFGSLRPNSIGAVNLKIRPQGRSVNMHAYSNMFITVIASTRRH